MTIKQQRAKAAYLAGQRTAQRDLPPINPYRTNYERRAWSAGWTFAAN